MSEGWKYDVLSELVTVINGLWKGKKEPFINVGVIRNANFNKDITLNYSNIEYLDVEERQYKTRKLLSGDLIVEKSGGSEKQPVGRTVLFRGEGEFSVSNFTSILRIKDQNVIIPEFLYKYLLFVYYSGVTKAMQKATTGIHNILFDKFLAIQIPIPSIVEQERIVSLLDLEFAKIDAIKANAEKQLQDAKKIYQNILSDLFVPKDNWDIIKLKDIVNYRRGSFPQPYGNKEWYGGEDAMPFVQVAEMQEDKFDLIYPTNRQISKIAQEYSVFVPKNTVLVSLQGSIGKVAITQYDCYVDRTIAIFTGYKKDVVKEFFAYQVKFKFAIEALNARGTTIKTITKEEFSDFSIRIAPYEEQKIIVKKLDILSERLKQLQSNYEQTITLCSDLKQSILKDIFG